MKIGNIELSDNEYESLKFWSIFAKNNSLIEYELYWALNWNIDTLGSKAIDKFFNNDLIADDYNDLRELTEFEYGGV